MRLHSAGSLLRAVGLVFFCATVQGQTTAQPGAPNPFASEPYIVNTSATVTSMNADGTGTRTQTLAVAIQSESALHDLSVLTILYSSQSEHADFVYARVVHPDGTTQETPIDGAIQQPAPVTQQAPLYSDLQTKQLPIKGLRVGDQLQWQARFTVYHTEVPGQFWGQSTFLKGPVILDDSYELRVPAGLHLTVWTNPRAGAVPAESDQAGQHIYRWHHTDLHPTVGPDAAAAKKAESKRLLTSEEELDEEKGKLPSFAWTTFPDWASVGAWYSALVTNRITPDDAIKAKVAELTAGKSTDLERAQAVYTFVSARIRYVGVDFGVGAYQPHAAAEVFANQYGDCKDKHVLLASMLSVLNLHADPVLIGAGVRFNSAVPSPAAFNHLITRLSRDGHDVWLDSTAETAIWGALLKPIRDQDALVIPAAPPALVIHTPIDLPYPQISNASVVGALDSSLTSDSRITFTLHDDDELLIRSLLRNVSPSNYDVFVQQMMAGMGFGGTSSEPEIDHLEDPTQPLQISLHYHRVKEKDWGDNRITVAFQPIALPAFTMEDPPTSTIELGSVRTEDSTLEMQLPDGWSAELPTAVHAHQPFANCDVTYSVKDHKLIAERRLTVLQSKVPIKDFKEYQAWYDDSGASGYPYIQLHPAPKVTLSPSLSARRPLPIPGVTAGSSVAEVKPADPKAAKLIEKANADVASKNLDDARKHLDQATAINPTEAGLWTAHAMLDQELGGPTQVMADLQRELSLHPDEKDVYYMLAGLQAFQDDLKGELATLHDWIRADPNSVQAALMLTNVLVDVQRPEEAAVEAHAALDRLPNASAADHISLLIAAARADVQQGHASEAANSVAPLLAQVDDPDRIDEIAHILAQAKQHLGAAADAVQTLIDTNEAETRKWVPIGTFRTALVRNQLAAEWNTLALILFQQGHTHEALGYAMASLYADDNLRARAVLITINEVALDPRAAAALNLNSQALRTFPLGPAKGHEGVATFSFLLGDGKIIGNEPSSTEPASLPNAGSYLKAADLHDLFPPGSKVHITRVGSVNCHGGACELVLIPAYKIQMAPAAPPAN